MLSPCKQVSFHFWTSSEALLSSTSKICIVLTVEGLLSRKKRLKWNCLNWLEIIPHNFQANIKTFGEFRNLFFINIDFGEAIVESLFHVGFPIITQYFKERLNKNSVQVRLFIDFSHPDFHHKPPNREFGETRISLKDGLILRVQ